MIKQLIKRISKRLLGRFDMMLLERAEFRKLYQRANDADKWKFLDGLEGAQLAVGVDAVRNSESQIGQDLFVLRELGWKRDGYFVEFGATNGRLLSNSWMLETRFGWNGILAEPARTWHEALANSGRNAAIEWDCVWDRTGDTLTFMETDLAELSTARQFAAHDAHDRRNSKSYPVSTISLNDMLAKHAAPAEMDYLSIDTEGSELKILRSLDFAKYRFACITCEHNHSKDREEIHDLLARHGYERRHKDLSKWDDWYVYAG